MAETLCNHCRRAVWKRIPTFSQSTSTFHFTKTTFRTVATASSTPNAAPSTPPLSTARDSKEPSAPVSSVDVSGNQAFNTPFFPSTSADPGPAGTNSAKQVQNKQSKRPSAAAPKRLVSSIPGGAELRGLGYTKANPSIYAKEDDEYPDWLWKILDQPKNASNPLESVAGNVDLASMTRKSKAKYERKQAKLLAGMEKPIPLHEQSKDLTGAEDDAVTSLQRRQELTKSSRVARRKSIREDNFLRAM